MKGKLYCAYVCSISIDLNLHAKFDVDTLRNDNVASIQTNRQTFEVNYIQIIFQAYQFTVLNVAIKLRAE